MLLRTSFDHDMTWQLSRHIRNITLGMCPELNRAHQFLAGRIKFPHTKFSFPSSHVTRRESSLIAEGGDLKFVYKESLHNLVFPPQISVMTVARFAPQEEACLIDQI